MHTSRHQEQTQLGVACDNSLFFTLTSSSVMMISMPSDPFDNGAAISRAVRYWLLTLPFSCTCKDVDTIEKWQTCVAKKGEQLDSAHHLLTTHKHTHTNAHTRTFPDGRPCAFTSTGGHPVPIVHLASTPSCTRPSTKS